MSGYTGEARVVPLRPEELDDEQVALYDTITGGRRASGPQLFRLRHDDGSLTGPFDLLLRHPAIGRRLSDLGEALRYEGTLSARAREVVILTVGATRAAAFEWYAHEPIARSAGMTDDEIDAIRIGDDHLVAEPEVMAAYETTLALLRHEPVDDAQFERSAQVLTAAGLIELTALVGYYDLLASLLNLFRVGVPDDSGESVVEPPGGSFDRG